jgi:hypothetical protein
MNIHWLPFLIVDSFLSEVHGFEPTNKYHILSQLLSPSSQKFLLLYQDGKTKAKHKFYHTIQVCAGSSKFCVKNEDK